MEVTSIKLYLHADELILFILLGCVLPSIGSNTDYSALVYKNCTSETFKNQLAANPSNTQQALASLFSELVAHSLQSKFFKTTADDEHGGISGLYQCRGDITNEDCHGCVTKLPQISNSLCNRATAAKLQLAGCYLRYEADSFTQAKDQLPVGRRKYEAEHKVCSREKAEIEGFYELRNSAFEELEAEVLIKHGYYTVEKEGFRAVAQCEEDMEGCECGECINEAAEIAKEVCERAVWGKVFLDHCSVGYEFGYHGGEGGFGDRGGFPGFGGGGFSFPGYHEDEGHHNGRQVAIIIGGVVAAVLLIFLLLVGCAQRKDDS